LSRASCAVSSLIHEASEDLCRVILKDGGVEIELGSIGVQYEGWVSGIDNIVPIIGKRRTASARLDD
jgi:hypothetical protein